MKKILSILMIAAMLMSVLSVVSCSFVNLDELESQLGDIKEKETDEEGTPIENGTTGGNGTTASGGSENELPDSGDSAKAKLEALGKTDGYEITLKVIDVSGNEYSTISCRKGNVWWSYNEDRTEGKALTGDDTHVIAYAFSDGEWRMTDNLAGQSFDNILPMYATDATIYLYMANMYGSELKYAGEDRVAGRACSKYTYSVGALGASLTWNACVDKELGITLKWKMETASEGERAGTEMEVTSFKTGSDVTVPTLPAPGEEYADYTGAMGWPDNSYTALIPKAPGTVSMSLLQDGRFGAVMKDVTEADYNAYLNELKAKGFTGETQDGIFEGTDAAGNTASVTFSDGQLVIAVTKAE